jgi:hypothetical protein
MTTAGRISLLCAYVILWVAVWFVIPYQTRTYVALSVVAGSLVSGGFALLIYVIPSDSSDDGVKTEFYSARAAYLSVIIGLALFVVIAVGATFARVLVTVQER